MSECVVRMEMPDDCSKCGVRHICNPYVDYWQQDTRKKPNPGQKGCRIICSLPEGHGRLVDVDAVFERARGRRENGDLMDVALEICNAPTIVPAEAERSET